MRLATAPRRELVTDAAASADKAAALAGVEILLLHELSHFQAGAALLAEIWGADNENPPVSKDVLRALAHSGNYVTGAFLDGAMVGISVGFFGQHNGHPHLHSHISGVAPDSQRRHIGYALKQHQRAWCLSEGLDRVVWTFDPLVRRNAYFNLAKLGATITEFHPNFYGRMSDGINAGDESDRVVVEWRLVSPAAIAAASGADGHDGAGEPAGAVVLRPGDDGTPEIAEPAGERLAAWVPTDVVELRQRDPQLAVAWRLALRQTFGHAIQSGYAATNMTRSGWYELERRPQPGKVERP